MVFKDFNLSEFLRYTLTGFNFIFFVIVLPLTYLQPTTIKALLADSSVLPVFAASIALGYLFDIFKFYQFSPRYNANRAQFIKNISEILDIPKEQALSYLELTTKLWEKNNYYHLEERRSKWVLSLHTAITLIISAGVWGYITYLNLSHVALSPGFVIPVGIALLCCGGSIRLFRSADREREKNNQAFYLILKKNKTRIHESWRLQTDKATKESIEND